MKTKIKPIRIDYKGKKVNAHVLKISSKLHLEIDFAWHLVKRSNLFLQVSKGMVKFKPLEGQFPEIWKEGISVKMKMLLFGFIPMGGLRTIYFKEINDKLKVISTEEHDSLVKVWNHKISMEKRGPGIIKYTDEIVIYAGVLTDLMSYFAKILFSYRQRRWKKLTPKKISRILNEDYWENGISWAS